MNGTNACINTPRNICCGYLLEVPRWGNSNKYPEQMFSEQRRKKKRTLHYLSYCFMLGFFRAANPFYWQNLGEQILSL